MKRDTTMHNIVELALNRMALKSLGPHYELWKRILELQGPAGLKLIPDYNDEPLKGEWKGYHSSRSTRQWRVIYSVSGKELSIYVIDVNSHNYKKKR